MNQFELGLLLVGVFLTLLLIVGYIAYILTRPKVTARRGLMGTLFGSGRNPTWDKADRDYHATHKTCEMCGVQGGALGGLDGAPGVQTQLEAHDVQPYHTLTHAQQNDYNFIMANFIMLHHLEHHRIAHCGDPNCYQYNPKIRETAAVVLANRVNCTK
jgi:hypothetical protein